MPIPPSDQSQGKGHVTIEVVDADGNVIETREVENLVTTVGIAAILEQLLASPANAKPSHMAIGTGTNAPAAGNTALQTEAARVALATKTRSGAVVTYTASFPAGTGSGAITEAGLLNAGSNGDLYQRVTFSAINKDAAVGLNITWTYTLT